MKRFFWKVLCCILYLIAAYLLAIQAAYFLSFHYDMDAWKSSGTVICLDPSVLWWQGNNKYFWFSTALILVGLFTLILNLFRPSKKDKEMRNIRRGLTHDEKLQYTHIASVHEAKKGLQRLQFNSHADMSDVFCNPRSGESRICFWMGHALVVIILFCCIQLVMMAAEWLVRLIKNDFEVSFIVISLKTAAVIIACCLICLIAIGTAAGIRKSKAFTGMHIRDYCDLLFNPHKHLWNILMVKLKQQDVHKMNELKKWNIDGVSTCRRSGLPILTKRSKIWVDAEDSHSLIIGTTNSGKTYSVIHGMIEADRMAGQSMFINDIKGNLYEEHAALLERDGYNIVVIDFVHPELSECWNPFGVVVKHYREAQRTAYAKMGAKLSGDYISAKIEVLQAESIVLHVGSSIVNGNDKEAIDKARNAQMDAADTLRAAKEKLHSIELDPDFAYPDFNDTFEKLSDICRTLCEEKDSKQPFFWQQSQAMMEGLVCFLLEHEYVNEEGQLKALKENQINFQNINLLKNQGFQDITVKGRKKMALEYYLTELRKPTDKSYEKLIGIVREPEETRGSVASTFDNHIALGIMNAKIEQMTSITSFNFEDFVKQKTAIFLIVHDEKRTYYPFVTIFVSQLYNEIVANARHYPNQRLPIPMDIIWDEFGISPAISEPDSIFSASRFRGVRWNIVIQDYSQLDKNYGKEVSKAIKNNIMNTVYLLGGDPQTLKEVSDKAGKKLQWNKEKGVFDTVPVISPDRLQHFSLSEALILRQRRMPVLTRYYPYGSYVYYRQIKKFKRSGESKLTHYDVFSILEDYAALSDLFKKAERKPAHKYRKVRMQDVYGDAKQNESDNDSQGSGDSSGSNSPQDAADNLFGNMS